MLGVEDDLYNEWQKEKVELQAKLKEADKNLRHSEEEKECFDKRITELEQANKWVSCEERLPEGLENCLVYVNPKMGGAFYATAWTFKGVWEVHGAHNSNAHDLITHWKPIETPNE